MGLSSPSMMAFFSCPFKPTISSIPHKTHTVNTHTHTDTRTHARTHAFKNARNSRRKHTHSFAAAKPKVHIFSHLVAEEINHLVGLGRSVEASILLTDRGSRRGMARMRWTRARAMIEISIRNFPQLSSWAGQITSQNPSFH